MSHELRKTGRDQNSKLDLPVPNYSGGRSVPMKPYQNNNQTIDDYDIRQIYNFSESLKHSDNGQEDEFAMSSSTTISQRESSQSHGSSYQASVYNGLPATALLPKQPYDMASKYQIPEQPTPPDIPLSNHEDHGKKESPKMVSLKQIEDYKTKATLLRQELETLKEQRVELRGDGTRSPSPDTKRYLKDNTKLQLEIQNKLRTIDNVLSMLNGIIGDTNPDTSNSDDPPVQIHNSRSPTMNKFNYVYYDPEMHWCRVCNEFPPTAKDYLTHLHSPLHQKMAAEHTESPWHCLSGINEGHQSYSSAPTKRIPIRGLQFFVPATAWYCKLCDQFIGDLHCASAHIKSIIHTKNYTNFVEHNPHWETDWMSDRQKAFEKLRTENKVASTKDDNACSVQYTSHTVTISKDFNSQRPRKSPSPELDNKKKYKKRRKDRSHSNDGSDSGNLKNNAKSKKLMCIEDGEIIEDLTSPPEQICEDDRKLLESLKSRMEKDREERQRSDSRERERIRLMQQRIRESELRGRSERRSISRDKRDRSRDRDPRRSRDWDRRNSRDRQDWRRDSQDRIRTSRDRRSDSRDRRTDSRARRTDSRERRTGSRERRTGSRERRTDTREQRTGSRERRTGSRERRTDTRERRTGSRERRTNRWERRTDSKERATDSPERRTDSRERATDSKEKRTGSQERQPESQEGQNDIDKKNDIQVVEMEEAVQPTPAVLPTPLPAAAEPQPPTLPVQPPLPEVTSLPSPMPPPVIMPPPQSLLLPPAQEIPSVPVEFQEALELLFPTDPQTCTEMLNAMQPGLLGAPPGMMFPPYMPPPGVFGYDPTAVFTPPLLPMMPSAPRANHRLGRQYRARGRAPAPSASQPRNKKVKTTSEKKDLDELVMLGIDASDVGAGR